MKSRTIAKKSKSLKKSRTTKKSTRKTKKPTAAQVKKCKKMLSEKIAINMREYKQGLYKSPKQAIAVSYAQIRKKSPTCNRVLSKK